MQLRPATSDDLPFLRRLYLETRRAEFAPLGLDERMLSALCGSQFDLRARSYAAAYPEAEDRIVVDAGEPVGRLLTATDGEAIWLVDVAILPASQGCGIGTCVLGDLLNEARRGGLPVRLHVVRDNPARRLYERLGFVPTVSDDPVRQAMVWNPD